LTPEIKSDLESKIALNPDDVEKYAESYANASIHCKGKKVYLHMKILDNLQGIKKCSEELHSLIETKTAPRSQF